MGGVGEMGQSRATLIVNSGVQAPTLEDEDEDEGELMRLDPAIFTEVGPLDHEEIPLRLPDDQDINE